MSFRSLTFQPGLNVQYTPTLNRAGWSDSNLIRWKDGLPEVIGGWLTYLTFPQKLDGVCRGLKAWATLAGVPDLGAGTQSHLYVCEGNGAYDITPLIATSSLTNPFDTVIFNSFVTVTDVSYAPSVGDWVFISGASAVGGITLAGGYEVTTIVSGTTYLINSGVAATSTVSGGGGSVTIDYLIPSGFVDASLGLGWGIGPWGAGTWGTPRSGGAGSHPATVWQMDNWGEELVAVRTPSPIYDWKPSSGFAVRATEISGAPPLCNGVLVAMPEQHMVAWGISIPDPVAMTWGNQDPMLVGWSNVSDYNDWFASPINSAGSFRITAGTEIRLGLRFKGQSLLWTDTGLTAMQFIGAPYFYGFQLLAVGCGIVSGKGAAVIGNAAYWWSNNAFWMYDGGATELECQVRDAVFGNCNTQQLSKVCCSVNSQFTEVQWEYPSAAATENDSYVSFNYMNKTWAIGQLARTARIDADVFPFPLAADPLGYLWNHEVGYSANGAAMPWFFESGFADLAEGEEYIALDQILPDFKLISGPVGVTVLAMDDNSDVPWSKGPYMVNSTSGFIPTRLRGRQLAIRVANDYAVPSLFCRLGRVRVRSSADGRRG